jgi:hypothetical protein
MINNGCRIMFLRDKHNQPQGCVAIIVDTDNKFAYYQLSVLNPVDRFCRELSRSIAIGRLYQGGVQVPLPAKPNMHVISRAIMEDIRKNPNSPTRAVKAAKLWLRKANNKIYVSN